MILTIHKSVITRIPRFSVTHDGAYLWQLQIKQITDDDAGIYMCQINTDPMLSQIGYLNVVGKCFKATW